MAFIWRRTANLTPHPPHISLETQGGLGRLTSNACHTALVAARSIGSTEDISGEFWHVLAPHGPKRGERSGGASLRYALSAPIRGERWSGWSNYTETITAYITLCFT